MKDLPLFPDSAPVSETTHPREVVWAVLLLLASILIFFALIAHAIAQGSALYGELRGNIGIVDNHGHPLIVTRELWLVVRYSELCFPIGLGVGFLAVLLKSFYDPAPVYRPAWIYTAATCIYFSSFISLFVSACIR